MKDETLEQAAERYYGEDDEGNYLEKTAFFDGADWQAKRLYSGEEVLKAQQAILGNIKDAMLDGNYIINYLKQLKK